MFKGTLANRAAWTHAFALAWSAMQVFGSRIVGQAASVIVALVIARVLGPADFGLYSFAIVTTLLLAQLPGTGLDMSAVRLSAREGSVNQEGARGILVVAGGTKLAFGLVLILASTVIADASVQNGFIQAELALPLRIAAVSALGLAMTEFTIATLQVQERFGWIFSISLCIAVIRIAPVGLLATLQGLDLSNALVAFLAATYVGCCLSLLFAWNAWKGPQRWQREIVWELYRYAGWLVSATLLGTLTSSLDILLLSHQVGAELTGIYAAGRTLALPFALLCSAVGVVLLPRLSRMPRNQIGAYVSRFSLHIVLAAAVMAAGIIIGAPVIVNLVYGSEYAAAATIFELLAFAYLAQLITWPFVVILMVFDRPDIIVTFSLVMLGIVAGGYLVILPSLGIIGVALIYFTGCTLMIIPYRYVAFQLLQRDSEQVLTPGTADIVLIQGERQR